MKFALVSHVLPPSWSGQSMMIYRLLKDLDAEAYCLISSEDYSDTSDNNYSEKLSGRYYHLRPESHIERGSRYRHLQNLANIMLGIVQRATNIHRIVRQEKCDAVVACTGGYDLLDLPAGYVASRMARVPFYPFVLDYYSYQWHTHNKWGSYPRLARWMERFMMRQAEGIIALNEFMVDELRDRYGARASLVRNPCDVSEYENNGPAARATAEFRIVFTGAIYEAHYDAFRNLIEAVRKLNRSDITLHFYTAQSPADLAKQGISGPIVYHPHEPLNAMPAIQQRADILFLPLAFASPYPQIVKTSAPTKLGEYLAVRRPILVHAPADSFLTWYFRRHGCGEVVDRLDPKALADAIERILCNHTLQRNITNRAWERAREDFDLPAARNAFLEIVQSRDSAKKR
jgi:glycosyltransferase involved in cell wall biosynthesis